MSLALPRECNMSVSRLTIFYLITMTKLDGSFKLQAPHDEIFFSTVICNLIFVRFRYSLYQFFLKHPQLSRWLSSGL
jgi:hypothetical protein